MPEMTIGKAAKLIGTKSSVLEFLCREGHLTHDRKPRGHIYIDTADIPERDWVTAKLSTLYQESLQHMLTLVAVVDKELEAIRLDTQESIENPGAPLGNDIRQAKDRRSSFDESSTDVCRYAWEVCYLWDMYREVQSGVWVD